MSEGVYGCPMVPKGVRECLRVSEHLLHEVTAQLSPRTLKGGKMRVMYCVTAHET